MQNAVWSFTSNVGHRRSRNRIIIDCPKQHYGTIAWFRIMTRSFVLHHYFRFHVRNCLNLNRGRWERLVGEGMPCCLLLFSA